MASPSPSDASEHEDATFLALPSRVRTKVDRAFDKAIAVASTTTITATATPAPRPRHPPIPNARAASHEAGGFLVDDDADAGGFLLDDAPGGFVPDLDTDGGGFVLDDAPEPDGAQAPHTLPPRPSPVRSSTSVSASVSASAPRATHIPLSRIPHALQLLDLPPADEQILAVFRNAASGWRTRGLRAGQGEGEEEEEGAGEVVSRRDWRAVCAVLLEGQDEQDGNGDEDEDVAAMDVDEDEEDTGDDDDDAGSESSDASSDAYTDAPTPRTRARPAKRTRQPRPSTNSRSPRPAKRRTRTRTRTRTTSPQPSGPRSPSPTGPRPPTARQKRGALAAFALFFPDPSGAPALQTRRLGIAEVQRAAGLLREKIKADEVRPPPRLSSSRRSR